MDNLKLQYQLSNGNWIDCADRTEEFLLMCDECNGIDIAGKIVPISMATRSLTRAEVVSALESGQTLRNDLAEWYSNCRSGSAHEAKIAARRAGGSAKSERKAEGKD